MTFRQIQDMDERLERSLIKRKEVLAKQRDEFDLK